MDVITRGIRENDQSIGTMKGVEIRGSLKEKLAQSFIIKSTNLKILDPIGQG